MRISDWFKRYRVKVKSPGIVVAVRVGEARTRVVIITETDEIIGAAEFMLCRACVVQGQKVKKGQVIGWRK